MTTKTFLEIKVNLFDKCNFEISNFEIEKESQDYSACKFQVNNHKIVFREAKITPTKIGQFVTLWKRNNSNIIQPFTENDIFDFVIIYTKTATNFGLFLFPKNDLTENSLISTDKKLGKLGFRVYPIWDEAENKQAVKTQKWQLNYFYDFSNEATFDFDNFKKILQ